MPRPRLSRLPLRSRRPVLCLVVAALAALGATGVASANTNATSETPNTTVQVWTTNGSTTTTGTVYAVAPTASRIYVGGDFNTAGVTSAGAVPVDQLISVVKSSGQLDTAFTAAVPGPVRAVLPWTDGNGHAWVFAGGYTADSSGNPTGGWLQKLDAATGSTSGGFTLTLPAGSNNTTGQVNALATDGSKLFVGGNFLTINGSARKRLAALNLTDGSLVSTFPTVDVDGPITAFAVGNGQLYLSGDVFTHVGNVERHEFASISTSTGAVSAWNPSPMAQGLSITLSPDGTWAYLTTGNGELSVCGGEHEGVIAVPAVYSGNPPRRWEQTVPNCAYNTGDVNSVAATATTVYIGGHLWALSGASQDRSHLAALDATTGQVLPFNPNLGGTRGVLALSVDTTTSPNSLLVGGDFGKVGNAYASGFAQLPIVTPDPYAPATPAAPALTSYYPGQVTVSWSGVTDHSDVRETYGVFRDGTWIASIVGDADPAATYTYQDRGLAPGSTHSYQIAAFDGTNSSGLSASSSIGVAARDLRAKYAPAVQQDGPTFYYPINEAAGSTTAIDASGHGYNGSYTPAARLGGATPIGDLGSSLNTDGLYTALSTPKTTPGPAFSIEAWFHTTHAGGAIAGFGDAANGFGSISHDRLLWMTPTGQLTFGVWPRKVVTIASTAGYADGAWHHVVATFGSGGLLLYVDGVLVASNTGVTSDLVYAGYWTFGGTSLHGWAFPGNGAAPPDPFSFVGGLDDIAIYPTQLSLAQIQRHEVAAGFRTATGHTVGGWGSGGGSPRPGNWGLTGSR